MVIQPSKDGLRIAEAIANAVRFAAGVDEEDEDAAEVLRKSCLLARDELTSMRDELTDLRRKVEERDAELAIARRLGVGHVLRTVCNAVEMGGVTASKLAEMLGYTVGDLHDDGLQRAANVTFEAARYVEEEERAALERKEG